ncbi:MAG: hypothetical protein B7Z63_05750 [Ignavibacteriae bacterium 37-53-5]|nr:MAG: hypothetical protein B7Z63_05750 [Ignavibacteriae bacterium 37-53-5]
MSDTQYKLVSLTNIQNELEEREMEAWQNLIRVLTHEIMNSVTPIISLSSTASSLLDSVIKSADEGRADTGRRLDLSTDSSNRRFVERPRRDSSRRRRPEKMGSGGESINDVKGALDTISRRSQGLLHFVDDYRNLTRIPAPNFQTFRVAELFGRIQKLFSDRFQVRNIRFSCTVEPADLQLTADPDLIEQVVINLITNSISAISAKSSPEIRLISRTDSRAGVLIQVADNGQGIPEEIQDKIFIPFFTTRKEPLRAWKPFSP